MSLDLANGFIEYETVKEIWHVGHKHHSKRKD